MIAAQLQRHGLNGAHVMRHVFAGRPVAAAAAVIPLRDDLLAYSAANPAPYPVGYDAFQGTSMAAPHVAGAVALLRALRPNITYQKIMSTLYETVDPIEECGVPMATNCTPKLWVPAPTGANTVPRASTRS